MNPAKAPVSDTTRPAPAIPGYLYSVYWWAYVHPRALRVFERPWLVNCILFGNYGRLRDRALQALGQPVQGHTLQIACVYGNLTNRLLQQMQASARLDVVDILPQQLTNLQRKVGRHDGIQYLQADAASIDRPDAAYDQVLLFFLLHEQPLAVRRATLAEAFRLVKPGGKVVVVDYHRPALWHPLRWLMRGIFRWLEPFAVELWQQPIEDFLPANLDLMSATRTTFFGGLYQLREFVKA